MFLLICTIYSLPLKQRARTPRKLFRTGPDKHVQRLGAATPTWCLPPVLRTIKPHAPLPDPQTGRFSPKAINSRTKSRLFGANHLFLFLQLQGEPAHDTSAAAGKRPSRNILGNVRLLPLGEMCLQVIVGSGLPVAMQVRLTLPPSLMEMSEEISMIFGDTATTQRGK